MFSANVKIIEALKAFVQMIATERAFLRDFCLSDKDFTRTRKLPFTHLIFLIARLCKKTLSVELESFFEQAGFSGLSCSVSAFTQQRLKLLPCFFSVWNEVLKSSFYTYYGPLVKRWKGYRVVAADGSSVSLVNNKALQKHFGGQENQLGFCYVLGRTFYHYDVLNEIIVSAQLKPWRTAELPLAYEAVETVEPDMLMVYDRGFSCYKMMALLSWKEQAQKFVIRAREKQPWIQLFLKSGACSSVVQLTAGVDALRGLGQSGFLLRRGTPLKVRLVRVELAHTTEVLLTNLWEEEGHSIEELKELYGLRWGVETNIGVQKNILQLESFSGLTVAAVLQDFYATVFMSNLHAVLIKEAEQALASGTTHHHKWSRKVNKNKSFAKLKANLVALFLQEEPATILHRLNEHFVHYPVPIRKGRTFKRIRQRRRATGKFKTYTNFKPAY